MYVYIFIFMYKHTGTVSARHLDCNSSRMFEIRNVSDIRYMYGHIHDVHVYIHRIALRCKSLSAKEPLIIGLFYILPIVTTLYTWVSYQVLSHWDLSC